MRSLENGPRTGSSGIRMLWGSAYRPRVEATLGLGLPLPTTDSTVPFKHARSLSAPPKGDLSTETCLGCHGARCIVHWLRKRSAWDRLFRPLTPLTVSNMPGPCSSTPRIALHTYCLSFRVLRASFCPTLLPFGIHRLLRAFPLTNSFFRRSVSLPTSARGVIHQLSTPPSDFVPNVRLIIRRVNFYRFAKKNVAHSNPINPLNRSRPQIWSILNCFSFYSPISIDTPKKWWNLSYAFTLAE